MQPSALEIEREVEALRDIRRRSSAPGALVIDPDLPEQAHPAETWAQTPGAVEAVDPHEDPDAVLASPSDPTNLFWVPARLHPEIDPSEFRAFLKEHARVSVDGAAGGGGLSRAGSASSFGGGGLGRKRSMLHKEYDPNKPSGNEDDRPVLRRNKSSMYQNTPQLTIRDLQKLEELAEEAAQSDDPSALRSVLRRSMSMNVSPSVIDQMDAIDTKEDDNAPIVLPPPGSILRRNARTKIRKAGTAIDSAHRFKSTRGSRASRQGASGASVEDPPMPRYSSDLSSSDHGDFVRSIDDSFSSELEPSTAPSSPPTSKPPSDLFVDHTRPMSFSEEAFIYDAYVHDDSEPDPPSPVLTTPMPQLPEPQPPLVPQVAAPVLQHPQPQRLAPPEPDSPVVSRTPSPEAPSISSSLDGVTAHRMPGPSHPPGPSVQPQNYPPQGYQPRNAQAGPSPGPQSPPPTIRVKEKEKDKPKGLFKWGKGGKEKEKAKAENKDSGFLGGLFGGSKKKPEDASAAAPVPGVNHMAGRETAHALLGASRSRAVTPSPSPGPPPGPNGNYARYPIHVERAIYRLSHIKLANPRRPLYEQVLISNLMFWYLGIINKAQSQSQLPPAQQPQPAGAEGGQGAPVPNGTEPGGQAAEEGVGPEQAQEARERAEQAQREREAQERQRQAADAARREPRRGTLTKANPGARRAEMPVPGPQYERQHQAMEVQYGGYGSAPPANAGGYRRGSPPGRSPHSGPPPLSVPPNSAGLPPTGSNAWSDGSSVPRPQSAPLPPGAMPPVGLGMEQGWMAQQQQKAMSTNAAAAAAPQPQPSRSRTQSQSNLPSAARSARSPPPPMQRPSAVPHAAARHTADGRGLVNGGAKTPGRSLSAIATNAGGSAAAAQQPPVVNGKARSISAHAVTPPGARPALSPVATEEDVPLGVWQQQQRRR